MTGPAETFRCAGASLGRAEPLAGTATHVRTWLLLEHTGPWGVDALRDARLPEGLGARLRDLAAEHRAKVLLVRRPGARRDPARRAVFAAYADPVRPRLQMGTVADLREVLDLDLAALRRGGATGLSPYGGSVLATCTNGRHDTCCAERGRPAAAALARAFPDEAWEVSHVGGDRFAANLVALPHGLYYGRVAPGSAETIARLHLAGRLALDHLRGRSSYPMAVQAAEIALLRELGRDGVTDLRLRSFGRGGEVVRAVFEAGPSAYAVDVLTTPGPPALLTCRAGTASPVPHHEVLGIALQG